MGELAIRRDRDFAVSRYSGPVKAEKKDGVAQSRELEKPAGSTASETLRQLASKASQAEGRARESRRTLQTGEGALAEVRDKLDRIGELARRAASGSGEDRAALQKELNLLREEIDRIAGSATVDGKQLFLDDDMALEDGMEALLYALLGKASGQEESIEALPDWLMQAIAQKPMSAEELLSRLGLDKNASGAEILAAIAAHPPESNSASAYLAALYLGAVIAGADPSTEFDLSQAQEGLRKLLETLRQGVSVDEAVEQLTNGAFTSFADFQAQFTDGTAKGLQEFLVNLLLTQSGTLAQGGSPLLSLLAGMEGKNLELLMSLLTVSESVPPGPGQDTAAMAEARAGVGSESQTAQTAAAQGEAGTEAAAQRAGSAQFGPVQVLGRELSGVSYDPSTGVLTVNGTEDITIQGREPGALPALLLNGSGKVTLQNVSLTLLTVSAGEARVSTAGESVLGEAVFKAGISLTLDGSGFLKIGLLQANESNLLRLASGAVSIPEQKNENGGSQPLAVPILVNSGASLAAHALHVSSFDAKPLDAFDVVWKALLPGWSSLTSTTVDGSQGKLTLMGGEHPDPARFWLDKGDPNHGYTIHTLFVQGRDEFGRPQSRYAYLRWNQQTGTFQEINMYPNPFAVTGGEPGLDWVYDEASHTLHILSAQVTAVSGGRGWDANQTPFSGRIVLADGIGAMELALGGVVCRVASGRAFQVGRENQVTLLLENGTRNFFESGEGCAGISLGDGASLRIDWTPVPDGGVPDGALTANGSGGGAGIGRDCGAGQDQSSQILICGGIITANGSGGGAGIGAGARGAVGSITISGGTVTANGGDGGGAGIGGALGAPAGTISIRGGFVTAGATYHAAAIGAGVQGECGDIFIAGNAHILKAVGGNPGADIGACLFGGCGQVFISDHADIGSAKLWTGTGIRLQMGEGSVTLPQFRLSSRALGLDKLSLLTLEGAQTAGATIDTGRRWLSRMQEAYGALYQQMEQSFSGLSSVYQYADRTQGLVRDPGTAGALLQDMRQSIRLPASQAVHTHSRRGSEDIEQLLR